MAYGNGSVYLRGSTWWIAYRAHGRRYRESSGSEVKRDAVRLLQRRVMEARQRERGAVIPMFEHAAAAIRADYRLNGRRSSPERRIRPLASYFAGLDLSRVTTSRIRAYADRRVRDGYAAATVNRELACLRRMMNLMRQDGALAAVPHFPMLAERNVRKGFVGEDELQAVLEHLPGHVRPIVEFGYVTGWRVSEILSRRWRHVGDCGVRLEPGETKNGQGREFPLIPRLQTVIEYQRERKAGRFIDPLFFYDSGQPVKSFRGSWENACSAAGLPGLLFHDLRRSAVRNLAMAGVDRGTAKELTGHQTDSIYQRYDIVDPARLREQAAKLETLYESAERKVASRRIATE